MNTSYMIRELCKEKNISQAELARRIGQSPQNFHKKLKRGTVSLDEIIAISNVLDVRFEQAFIFPNGGQIKYSTW